MGGISTRRGRLFRVHLADLNEAAAAADAFGVYW
jgi:hypothetical protein